jgi:hypothetical protein
MAANSSGKLSKFGKTLRELVAISVWLFAFIKLFIVDIDVILVDHFIPQFRRLLPYRFFVLTSLIAISWLVLGNRRFRIFGAYILLYPLVLIFWRLPKLFVKNWATILVFAPAIQSTIWTFKWRFVAGSLTMLAGLGILLSSNRYVVTISMVILFAYLLFHYVCRLRIAYKSSTFFATLVTIVLKMSDGALSNLKTKDVPELAKLSPDSDEFKTKRAANLQLVFISTLVLKAVARKLQAVFETRKTDLYFLGALLYSFVLTILIFALEYTGLYQTHPSSFPGDTSVSFWAFFLFSFNVIIHAGFASLVPAGRLAIFLANLELLAGIVVFIVFLFVLLTSNREKHRQDLKAAIDRLEKGVEEITVYVQNEFRLTMPEVVMLILESNPGFSEVIVFLGETPPALPK